jgi:hypothetical protein
MPQSIRIMEFDTWRPGYAGASVTIYVAGTTTPADLFYAANLTSAAPNPITLLSKTVDDVEYGKFPQPLYIGSAYQVLIDGVELTGVQRLPIYELPGADVSESVATSDRGTVSRPIEDWLDDTIQAAAFGTFGANATTNTTILTTAIGVAAAQGGGEVILPAGVILFNAISIPQGVFLRGQGARTTTLRSTLGQAVVTIGGNHAGLRDLQLDGVSVTASSVGVYAVGRTGILLENVIIDAFQTGAEFRGTTAARFTGLEVTGCTRGVDLRGDSDAGNAGAGSAAELTRWVGGLVEACTEFGVRLMVEDRGATRFDFEGVRFSTNVGPALAIEGAQMVRAVQCSFTGNTAVLDVNDGSDTDETPVENLTFEHCLFSGGTMEFAGACTKVLLKACDLSNIDITLSAPVGVIFLQDCIERADTTATGTTEKLVRNNSEKVQESFGITTDATPTTAWSRELRPYSIARAVARVMALQRNGTNSALYEIVAIAYRPGSEAAYDLASVTPAAGATITGVTSGATARIQAVNDLGGATGVLTLGAIVGEFTVFETVNISTGGTLRLTGALSPQDAAFSVAPEAKTPAFENVAGWNAAWAIQEGSISVRVTGAASTTIEWAVEVDVFELGA